MAGTTNPEQDPAPRPKRRSFPAEYKLRIVAEYDAAPNGEKGAILRRERRSRSREAYPTGSRGTGLDLVVAGEVVYNGVHLYLAGTDADVRANWFRAIDVIDVLNLTAVIAGHKNPDADKDPGILEETGAYLRDAEELLATATSVEDYVDRITLRHLTRINPNILSTALNCS